MRALLDNGPSQTTSAVFNGTWIAISACLGGIRLPQEALVDLPLIFDNGLFVLGVDEGRIAVHRGTTPVALDLIVLGGQNSGRFVPAIVESSTTMLRICLDLSGRQRPAAFHAPVGSRCFCAVYKRAPGASESIQVALAPSGTAGSGPS